MNIQNIPGPATAAARRLRRALPVLAAAALLAGCVVSDLVHRVSFDVPTTPKDLRACVVEATRGIDGVPGVDAPAGGIETSLVAFRTTLPEVSGEVERQDGGGVRVSIEVMARVEPGNFWEFAQPRAKAIADAIAAKCGAL